MIRWSTLVLHFDMFDLNDSSQHVRFHQPLQNIKCKQVDNCCSSTSFSVVVALLLMQLGMEFNNVVGLIMMLTRDDDTKPTTCYELRMFVMDS